MVLKPPSNGVASPNVHVRVALREDVDPCIRKPHMRHVCKAKRLRSHQALKRRGERVEVSSKVWVHVARANRQGPKISKCSSYRRQIRLTPLQGWLRRPAGTDSRHHISKPCRRKNHVDPHPLMTSNDGLQPFRVCRQLAGTSCLVTSSEMNYFISDDKT